MNLRCTKVDYHSLWSRIFSYQYLMNDSLLLLFCKNNVISKHKSTTSPKHTKAKILASTYISSKFSIHQSHLILPPIFPPPRQPSCRIHLMLSFLFNFITYIWLFKINLLLFFILIKKACILRYVIWGTFHFLCFWDDPYFCAGFQFLCFDCCLF